MGETLDASPARHLRMLLARAQNPFDVSDEVVDRLAGAVLCQVDMHAGLHRPAAATAARCGRARHSFLLADGSVQTLWELWHLGSPGADRRCPDPDLPFGRPRFEIYESEEALRVSERRVHGTGDIDGVRMLLEETPRSRPWSRQDSPDHARRLLRRAENPDRPGDETLRLLSDACGHDIMHVARPRTCPPGRQLWCSLYEHAFLLTDGTEVRLYELEHNLTGGEGLVCEVYPDEATADRAARRHARARGIEL